MTTECCNGIDAMHHSRIELVVWGDERVWVSEAHGLADNPMVALNIMNFRFVGSLIPMRDRFAAMVDLLDQLIKRPEEWDQIPSNRVRAGDRPRGQAFLNPFENPIHNPETDPPRGPVTGWLT